MSEELKESMNIAIEVVAREHAKESGFDMQKEPHALMRMMACVFSSKDLFRKAIDRAKELASDPALLEQTKKELGR